MSTSNSIKLGLAYENTDFERTMTLRDVATANAAIETVRTKVKAVNASLAGGTADGLETFLRADDYDPNEDIGKLKEIKSCVVNVENTTYLIGGDA